MDDILHHLPEFFGNHSLLVMIFVGLLLALIGSEVARLFRGYREVTPAALTLLINRENALVVDLSSTQDFDKGHIAGSRNVQMSQFDPENKELAKAKELPIAVYCKAGTTSAQAAARLVKAGFKKVYWLGGGLAAWRAADLPTTRK
jgi:rhodanese-related sulfurtransferase